MVNPEYNVLKDWMFGKLNALLENLEPNPKYRILKMSLGEPSLSIPSFVGDELMSYYNQWGKYPPSEAISRLGDSILRYIERRYPGAKDLVKIDRNIVPVPGTREPLHLTGLLAKNRKIGKTYAIVTNPFYHTWRAGGISSNSEVS